MITIVLDTPIYVINELGKSDLVPYGPPTHSKRSARGVFFNVSTSSESFDRESLVTVLNAYDPEQTPWKRKAFRMFSRGYESSHHVIEILVSSRISSSELTFDVPSSVSLFDRSGHRLRISKLPVDIVLPKDDKRVHVATIFDVMTPTLKPLDSCGKLDQDDDDISPLSQVELENRIRIPGVSDIISGVISGALAPITDQITAVETAEQESTLGTKIVLETGANAPVKVTEYVSAAVT